MAPSSWAPRSEGAGGPEALRSVCQVLEDPPPRPLFSCAVAFAKGDAPSGVEGDLGRLSQYPKIGQHPPQAPPHATGIPLPRGPLPNNARAHGLAVARVRSIVDALPALDDQPPAAEPAQGRATPVRPGLTPGSPSRREVSVRRVVLLSDQIAAHRQRIASFESRVSDGPSKRDLQRLREAMERTHQGLEELLDRADSAHRVRGTDGALAPSAPDAAHDARTIRVPARIAGIKVVHDGRNLLGVDVSVVADEDGTTHVAHLTRRGTKLIVDGAPGRIKQLKLDQAAVLIVDPGTGEILELRVARPRPGTDRGGSSSDRP